MERIIRRTAEKEMPLGVFLSGILGLTKKEISQAKFRDRGICVNGIQRRITFYLLPGDLVEVKLEDAQTFSGQLHPLRKKLDILWEDEDLLAVNKPAGIVVHPSHGHFQDTLANMVMAHAQEQGENLRIRAVGRLDNDTSGIVLFAKNQVAAARLGRQRESGSLKKTYLAVASGNVETDSGLISTPIRKQPDCLMKMEVNPEDGKASSTQYHVLERKEDYTWVKVNIRTGRTHQIRVHFASIGHPLLGDSLYGGSDKYISRTALHAWRTEFSHPVQNILISLKAPLPQDFPEPDFSKMTDL